MTQALQRTAQDRNLLLPTSRVVRMSPFHNLTSTEVVLDVTDAHQMTWGQDPTFMPSRSQVEKLATAANIQITKSKMLRSRHNNIIDWQATAKIEKISEGKTLSVTKTYTLDLRTKDRDGEDGSVIKLMRQRKWDQVERAKNRNKFYGDMPGKDGTKEEWVEWVEAKVRREFEQVERYSVQRAETGASLRCCRTLLGMKGTYTREEMQRPFVVYTATLNIQAMLRYGGPMKEMALRTLAGAFGSQLGISGDGLANLLTDGGGSSSSEPENEDLLLLEEGEIEDLITEMDAFGLKDRRQCDALSNSLFDTPLSGLTQRGGRLIIEALEMIRDVSKFDIDAEMLEGFKTHVRERIGLAYADGEMILSVLDEEWYELLVFSRDHNGDDGEEEEDFLTATDEEIEAAITVKQATPQEVYEEKDK